MPKARAACLSISIAVALALGAGCGAGDDVEVVPAAHFTVARTGEAADAGVFEVGLPSPAPECRFARLQKQLRADLEGAELQLVETCRPPR